MSNKTSAPPVAYLNSGIKLVGHDDQISREIDYFRNFYKGLRPAMVISYEREAFFGNTDPDFRVTFDENILWREEDLTLRKDAYGNAVLLPGQCLMEIKVAQAMPLCISRVMNRLGIFQTSFSKYGRAYEMKQLRDSVGAERRA